MMGSAGPGRTTAGSAGLAPWRDLYEGVRATLAGAATAGWVSVTPTRGPEADGAPLLVDASVAVDLRRVGPWVRGLLDRAATVGDAAATLRGGRVTDDMLVSLLEASIADDGARTAALARTLRAEPGALAAVAALAVMPLLHACRRALGDRMPAGWACGHCPVCGAWPTLAEARGVERSRHYGCGRCGAGWFAGWLRCPYCGNSDHRRAGALVGEGPGARDRVETCEVCRGYVKTLTVLLPIPPDRLALADLDSLALDVAALLQGYRRPRPPARLGAMRVTGKARPR